MKAVQLSLTFPEVDDTERIIRKYLRVYRRAKACKNPHPDDVWWRNYYHRQVWCIKAASKMIRESTGEDLICFRDLEYDLARHSLEPDKCSEIKVKINRLLSIDPDGNHKYEFHSFSEPISRIPIPVSLIS